MAMLLIFSATMLSTANINPPICRHSPGADLPLHPGVRSLSQDYQASPHQHQAQWGQGWLSLPRLRPRVSSAVPSCGLSSAHSTALGVCPVSLRAFSQIPYIARRSFSLSWGDSRLHREVWRTTVRHEGSAREGDALPSSALRWL